MFSLRAQRQSRSMINLQPPVADKNNTLDIDNEPHRYTLMQTAQRKGDLNLQIISNINLALEQTILHNEHGAKKESHTYKLLQTTDRKSEYNQRIETYNAHPALHTIKQYIDYNIGEQHILQSDDSSQNRQLDNMCIPLECYTCWHTTDLPTSMAENYVKLKSQNKEINFHLYDEIMCRAFISDHFERRILDAYDKLVPSAYKSDLWRFCVLYQRGGIYLDIKYGCVGNFKLVELCTQDHFVLDNIDCWAENQYGLYTACIMSKPNNPILFECIETIAFNVENEVYGWNALYPTGPGLLGQIYFQYDLNAHVQKTKDIHLFYINHQILYKWRTVMKVYDEYRQEQTSHQSNYHYSQLWEQRAIYQKSIKFEIVKPPVEKNRLLRRVLLIVHVGNMDIFSKMVHYIRNVVALRNIEYQLDAYFNVIDCISREHIESIQQMFPHENIVISENYGFDVGSFFHVLDIVKRRGLSYDYVLKLHTKTEDVLREGLISQIAGSAEQIVKCIRMLNVNPTMGCIGSLHSKCIDHKADFDRNITYLQILMKQYLHTEPRAIDRTEYISGTMFWMRFEILQKVFGTKTLMNTYNSMNNVNSFDWVWYYYANRRFIGNTPFNKTKLYNHYLLKGKTEGLSGNLFHCIKHKTKSVPLRDAMIEHAYERFFAYMLKHYGYGIHFL
jgi:mannosyltransferase OCH1-like enzyme